LRKADLSWKEEPQHNKPGSPFGTRTQRSVKEADSLAWWKDAILLYPYVADVARCYLADPATSVPSEQLFSGVGNIVTGK